VGCASYGFTNTQVTGGTGESTNETVSNFEDYRNIHFTSEVTDTMRRSLCEGNAEFSPHPNQQVEELVSVADSSDTHTDAVLEKSETSDPDSEEQMQQQSQPSLHRQTSKLAPELLQAEAHDETDTTDMYRRKSRMVGGKGKARR